MNSRQALPTSVSADYWEALDEGRLVFQSCGCGHNWLPPRPECPKCLGDSWVWRDASGRGRLVSWVVYRFAYDEAFKSRLPYNVAIVELEEGVRMISNIIGAPDGAGLVVDMPLQLSISRDGKTALATFARDDNQTG